MNSIVSYLKLKCVCLMAPESKAVCDMIVVSLVSAVGAIRIVVSGISLFIQV